MLDLEPWPNRFVVPPAKILGYLLNPLSDDGASKAAYFSSYGFSISDPGALASALEAHACPENFVGRVSGAWGLKFLFEGPLPAPNGRDATIRSVWMMDGPSDGDARFVTAVPNGL